MATICNNHSAENCVLCTRGMVHGIIGQRVEIPVHYDMWMRGARFGTVTSHRNSRQPGTSDYVNVRLDHPATKKLLKVWRMDWPYMKLMNPQPIVRLTNTGLDHNGAYCQVAYATPASCDACKAHMTELYRAIAERRPFSNFLRSSLRTFNWDSMMETENN